MCVCGPVCGPLGVADRNRIPDARMTARTYYTYTKNRYGSYGSRSYTYYYPYYGRLNEGRGGRAWCAETTSDRRDYLQVDMGTVHSVCAVATQGQGQGSYWTTSYRVDLSLDGVTWNAYQENSVQKVN